MVRLSSGRTQLLHCVVQESADSGDIGAPDLRLTSGGMMAALAHRVAHKLNKQAKKLEAWAASATLL
jgi:hypothetical protein